MLLEPIHWQSVQQRLRVEDFASPELKALAEAYWNYQRDEGEPVFSEFVSLLTQPQHKSLAIELANEAESIEAKKATIEDCLKRLDELSGVQEEQKMLSSAANADEAQQIDILRRLQEKARQPNLRRLGS